MMKKIFMVCLFFYSGVVYGADGLNGKGFRELSPLELDDLLEEEGEDLPDLVFSNIEFESDEDDFDVTGGPLAQILKDRQVRLEGIIRKHAVVIGRQLRDHGGKVDQLIAANAELGASNDRLTTEVNNLRRRNHNCIVGCVLTSMFLTGGMAGAVLIAALTQPHK